MKGFSLVALLAGMCLSQKVMHQGREQIIRYTPPSEVFGPVNATRKARSALKRRAKHLSSNKPEYYARRTAADCTFPMNVMILQDSTGSFETGFFEMMGQALAVLSDEVFNDHPGSSFSVVSYQDKPINNLGEVTDICYTVNLVAANNTDEMLSHYTAIRSGGGFDWPENQYGAIVAAMKSPQTVNWMPNDLASNLIIHITDAGPHFDGDDVQYLYPQLAQWPGSYDEFNSEDFCTRYYYPDPWTVADAVLDKGAYFTTLVYNADIYGTLGLRAWQWFNELLNQPDDFVTAAENDTLTWLAHLVGVINGIRAEECGSLETTTEAPGTEASGSTQSTEASGRTESTEASGRTESTEASGSLGTDESSSVRTEPTEASGTVRTELTGSTGPASSSHLVSGSTSSVSTPTEPTGSVQSPLTSSAPGSDTTSNECECPSDNPCCKQQPEFILAILKRPSELDLHMKE